MKAIYGAILKFQKEVPSIIKDKSNPFFKSKYSDLSSVINGVQETLSKCELGIVHSVEIKELNNVLVTILFHSSGEQIRSEIIIPTQNDPQKLGSLITYLKRYTYMAILGVASEDDDDDANNASNKKTYQAPINNYNQQKEAVNNQVKNDTAPGALEGLLPTGKYAGKTIREVILTDRQYIQWLADKSNLDQKLKAIAFIALNEKK